MEADCKMIFCKKEQKRKDLFGTVQFQPKLLFLYLYWIAGCRVRVSIMFLLLSLLSRINKISCCEICYLDSCQEVNVLGGDTDISKIMTEVLSLLHSTKSFAIAVCVCHYGDFFLFPDLGAHTSKGW